MGRKKSLRGEIADAIGKSPATVTNCWKKGMPRHDVQAAVDWYQAHVGRGKMRVVAPKAVDVELVGEPVEVVAQVRKDGLRGLAAGVRDLEDELERISQKIKSPGIQNNAEQYAFFLKAHMEVTEQLRKVQKDLFQIHKQENEAVTVSEAEAIITQLMKNQRQALDRVVARVVKNFKGDTKVKLTQILEKEVNAVIELFASCEFYEEENFRDSGEVRGGDI